jgi:hypothetical protein
MANNCYKELSSKISPFLQVHHFFDDQFIFTQCEHGLKNYLLICLAEDNPKRDIGTHSLTLERRLVALANVSGYEKLKPLLQRAASWDNYQEALAQLDITLWFQQKGLVKEIEPKLTHRIGNADILLLFNNQSIFCEISAPRYSFRSGKDADKIKDLEIQNEGIKIDKVTNYLSDKVDRQLPPNEFGIIALDVNKSDIFAFDMRLIAEKLLPKKLQIALIALWSAEGRGEFKTWDIPTVFFINRKSKYQHKSEALIQFLDIKVDVQQI